MSDTATTRLERRSRQRAQSRAAILEAARTVAARDGARDFSLRSVAAEAGFAPAALYGYFANKDELLLALAADDLAALARAMREAGGSRPVLVRTATAALELLRHNETFAAAQGSLPPHQGTSEAERLFNGRLIAVLKVLSEALGSKAHSRDGQRDVVLLAATLAGLALLARSGRLAALGFTPEELLQCLDRHFGA